MGVRTACSNQNHCATNGYQRQIDLTYLADQTHSKIIAIIREREGNSKFEFIYWNDAFEPHPGNEISEHLKKTYHLIGLEGELVTVYTQLAQATSRTYSQSVSSTLDSSWTSPKGK